MSKLLEQINTDKNEMTLGDVVTFHRGYDLPLTEIKKGIYPVVFSNGRKECHNEFKVKAPGVFTGRSGSLGGMFYINEDYWPHNTTLYVSDFHNNDPKYCYYFLSSFDFSKYNAGTGVPTLNRNHIHGIPVKIPNLPTQKKIAEILSAYDAKIENNNLIIKKLEATAQTIFNEWFVNFRFPGYEKVKFIGGEMGEIPYVWKIKKIEDFCETFGGGTPSTKESSYWQNGSVAWATPTDMTSLNSIFIDATAKKISQDGLQNSSAKLLPAGSILMTSRATVGVLSISKIPISTNQGFIACVCKDNAETLYFFWWLKDNISLIKGLATGSTFPEISRSVFRNIKVLVPTENTLSQFEEKVSHLHDQIYLFQKENILLKNSRDRLLAKLI